MGHFFDFGNIKNNERTIRKTLTIEMEMLPAEVIKDKNALVEITDSKVLAHVNERTNPPAMLGRME